MPTGPQGQKRPADVVGCAIHVARIATGETEETPVVTRHPDKATGGKAGGPARAAKLTPAQRSEIARKAAKARWKADS